MVSGGLFAARSMSTDADGRFAIGPVPCIRGQYRIVALAGAESAPARQTLAGCKSKDDIDLRIDSCIDEVYGVVSDASGGPVAEARLFTFHTPERVALSDEQGRYRLCTGKAPSRLQASADGYGTWSRRVSARGATRQDVTLLPEATVVGNVVFARDRQPASFALVTLMFENSGDAVQADEAGRFRFAQVAPGSYTLTARTRHAQTTDPRNISARAGSETSVTLQLDPRATVHGRVVSRDGPVKEAGIRVGFQASGVWGGAQTRADGSFSIEDAPIGTTLVHVDEHDVLAPKTLRIPDEGVSGVLVEVEAKAQLRVTVLRKGAPVRGATVLVRSTLAGHAGRTESDGIATFKGVTESTYQLTAEHEHDYVIRDRVLVSKAKTTEVTVELRPGRAMSGKVVDENRDPVDGALVTVSLSIGETRASATTANDGSFEIAPLRGPATYEVKVSRSGTDLQPATEFPKVAVPDEGAPSPSPLALVVSDRRLTGTVVDSTDAPVPDAVVTVTPPARRWSTHGRALTAHDGSFEIRHLGPGPYTVRATAPSGSRSDIGPVSLPTGPLTIRLPSVGSIRGTLRGFARTPSVTAWPVAGYGGGSNWFSELGFAVVEGTQFIIDGLPMGRYHVAAAIADAAASATVSIENSTPVDVELVASGKRSIRGKTLDLNGGEPMPQMSCTAAPLIDGGRSPLVVPGTVVSGHDGSFEFRDAPASDLYMWCNSDAGRLGGVARLPADLGDSVVSVWGLDVAGRAPWDRQALTGFRPDNDFPMARRISSVEPGGPADRAGVVVGDVIEAIGGKSMADVSNGIAHEYLAILLTDQKVVTVGLRRGATILSVVFRNE